MFSLTRRAAGFAFCLLLMLAAGLLFGTSIVIRYGPDARATCGFPTEPSAALIKDIVATKMRRSAV